MLSPLIKDFLLLLYPLQELSKQIEGHTICALGDAAAWPVQVDHNHDDITICVCVCPSMDGCHWNSIRCVFVFSKPQFDRQKLLRVERTSTKSSLRPD